MKKSNLILQLFIFCSTIIFSHQLEAQLLVRNDPFVQIGYEDYRTLSFGTDINNSPNNGQYALEHWNNGLNFWKPWPSVNPGNYILFLREDHNVGIGNSGDASYRLDVEGAARSYGWATRSDSRLKHDINDLSNSLSLVMQLQGVSYKYNASEGKYDDINLEEETEVKVNTIQADNNGYSQTNKRLGFIAQDLRLIVPEAVTEEEEGYYNVYYDELIPLLVESIKEQQTQIAALENQVNVLTMEMNDFHDNGTTTTSSYLQNNYPNPTSDMTTIEYYIDAAEVGANSSIVITNSDGDEVLSLLLSNQAGSNSTLVSVSDLNPGSYVYSLVVDGVVLDSKTLIVVN